VGVDRVISVELQPPGQGQIEGFFPPQVPVENLRAASIAVDHLARLKLRDPVVVAPNESCIQLAHDLRAGLQLKTGRDVGLAAIMEAGPSRGSDRYAHSARASLGALLGPAGAGAGTGAGAGVGAGARALPERMELVGTVQGRDVIICDDMIDTARSLIARLQLLKERGANRVVAYAAHGLFNGGALQRISKSALSDVIVTNTVPLRDDISVRDSHKIAQLSVAPLLAEAVVRVQTGQSVQSLRSFESESAETRNENQ
jgi:ribose-phosphate pyrophosphokinase